jgi:hypothetical protein
LVSLAFAETNKAQRQTTIGKQKIVQGAVLMVASWQKNLEVTALGFPNVLPFTLGLDDLSGFLA